MAVLVPFALTLTPAAAPSNVAASAGGDSVPNPRGNVILRVANANASSINVTLAVGPTPTRPSDGTFPAMTLAANVVAVPSGQTRLIGPIPPAFNDGAGSVQIAYSLAASVTIEAYQP